MFTFNERSSTIINLITNHIFTHTHLTSSTEITTLKPRWPSWIRKKLQSRRISWEEGERGSREKGRRRPIRHLQEMNKTG